MQNFNRALMGMSISLLVGLMTACMERKAPISAVQASGSSQLSYQCYGQYAATGREWDSSGKSKVALEDAGGEPPMQQGEIGPYTFTASLDSEFQVLGLTIFDKHNSKDGSRAEVMTFLPENRPLKSRPSLNLISKYGRAQLWCELKK
jgi:hypothetical protein